MNKQSAILIDAGFLLAQGGAHAVKSTYRPSFNVSYGDLVKGIIRTVEADSQMPNLRTYWYDASRDGLLTQEQRTIALLEGMKVRLGRINFYGEQKGVDTKLCLDIVSLADTGAIQSIYILTGDDDISEAVEIAQNRGVRVVVIGFPSEDNLIGYAGIADNLATTVDRIAPLDLSLIEKTFTSVVLPDSSTDRVEAAKIISSALVRSAASPSEIDEGDLMEDLGPEDEAPPAPVSIVPAKRAIPSPSSMQLRQPAFFESRAGSVRTGRPNPSTFPISARNVKEQNESIKALQIGKKLGERWYATASLEDIQETVDAHPQIPREVDRALLEDCGAALGTGAVEYEYVRYAARWGFWDRVREQHGISSWQDYFASA